MKKQVKMLNIGTDMLDEIMEKQASRITSQWMDNKKIKKGSFYHLKVSMILLYVKTNKSTSSTSSRT
jgi:hypothetical protein